MMVFCDTDTGAALAWRDVVTRAKLEHPGRTIAFDQNTVTPAHLAPYGVSVVQLTEPPDAPEFCSIEEGQLEKIEGVWTQTWEIIEPSVSAFAAARKAQMAAARWQAQTAGVEYNGHQIDSSNETALYLREALHELNDGPPGATLKWKTKGGNFVPLNAQHIQAIGAAIFTHVQASFGIEEARTNAIDAVVADSQLTDQEKLAAINEVTWDDPPA